MSNNGLLPSHSQRCDVAVHSVKRGNNLVYVATSQSSERVALPGRCEKKWKPFLRTIFAFSNPKCRTCLDPSRASRTEQLDCLAVLLLLSYISKVGLLTCFLHLSKKLVDYGTDILIKSFLSSVPKYVAALRTWGSQRGGRGSCQQPIGSCRP